jgi:hypothetical protein
MLKVTHPCSDKEVVFNFPVLYDEETRVCSREDKNGADSLKECISRNHLRSAAFGEELWGRLSGGQLEVARA